MTRLVSAWLTLIVGVLQSEPVSAHCDTTKGPVVAAARAALEAGDPSFVMHWVRPEDEAAVRATFQHTIAVRALGPEAKALADRHFFETLVRIHRAGEGAPYTGLTDDEPEPVITATDRALESGSASELEQELVGTVKAGLAERLSAARAAKGFRPGDAAQGRAFVASYVALTHWVEGVLTAATGTGEHHAAATEHAPAAHPIAHESAGHAGTETNAESHGRAELQRLPWILAAVLAMAALVEGVLLLRRRRPSSSLPS